jgi:hypothetical protein
MQRTAQTPAATQPRVLIPGATADERSPGERRCGGVLTSSIVPPPSAGTIDAGGSLGCEPAVYPAEHRPGSATGARGRQELPATLRRAQARPRGLNMADRCAGRKRPVFQTRSRLVNTFQIFRYARCAFPAPLGHRYLHESMACGWRVVALGATKKSGFLACADLGTLPPRWPSILPDAACGVASELGHPFAGVSRDHARPFTRAV